MNVCVILNPGAGTLEDEAVGRIESSLSRLGRNTLFKTEEAGEGQRFARESVSRGCELVVAVGGDGTINEVVNGLAPNFSQARMGIIPLGTGNDFARSIGVPQDLDAAVDLIMEGRTEAVDVVRTTCPGVHYFINVTTCGFSGQLDKSLTRETKRTWGSLAYLRTGLEAAMELMEYQVDIRLDDTEHLEMGVYNIVVANAQYVAGGIHIAPEARLDDGLMDIIIVPAMGIAQLAAVVPQMLVGQHMGSALLHYRRARKVSVASQPPICCNLDGEGREGGPFTFEVMERALQVITGHRTQGV